MKKIVFVALCATAFIPKGFSQENTPQSPLPQFLSHYYNIKDALVAGNSSTAAASAEQFIKTLNTIDYKVISEGNSNGLLRDATSISEAKDLEKQRGWFANLSSNMTTLARAVKLSSQPIYESYCPMKKASWLSSTKEIENPYYSSAMLTCGKVVDTLQ